MKIFESFGSIEKFPNPVLTIGNYDGIHIGHQSIIRKVVEKAKMIPGTPMLMTFDPHPASILKPDAYTLLITPLHVKKRLIEAAGIEVMFIIPFDENFKNVSPETFVHDVLIGKLGIRDLTVGYDFKFGKEGSGDVKMLSQCSEKNGFSFEAVSAITMNGEKIGSNQIRRFIMHGEVEKAARFLGRPHMIEGIVVHGENRGKGMGFPTINLDTFFELVPKNGVYMTEAEIEGKKMPSVTNIGYNPTFGGKKFLMETHILDYTGDLYDCEVVIYFHERIRDEVKFKNMDELKERIHRDIAIARERFEKRTLHE